MLYFGLAARKFERGYVFWAQQSKKGPSFWLVWARESEMGAVFVTVFVGKFVRLINPTNNDDLNNNDDPNNNDKALRRETIMYIQALSGIRRADRKIPNF